MPPKKKESALKMEEEAEEDSDGENLQEEFDKLADTLNKLKRRREELIRENEFLQNEANQAHLESQAYKSYLSKQTQKSQSIIVTQNQEKLEALRRQREETQAEYQEQAGELRRLIEEKEGERTALSEEMSQLAGLKVLQQQQLGRIAELEKEKARVQRQFSESLQAVRASFISERQRYRSRAKHRVQAEALETRREASQFLQSHTRDALEENQLLQAELQQIIQRTKALKAHQKELQVQRQELLLERECVTSPSPGLSETQSKGKERPKTRPEGQANCKTGKTQNEEQPVTVPSRRQTPKAQPAGQARPNTKPSETLHSKTKPGVNPQSQPKPQGGSRA